MFNLFTIDCIRHRSLFELAVSVFEVIIAWKEFALISFYIRIVDGNGWCTARILIWSKRWRIGNEL